MEENSKAPKKSRMFQENMKAFGARFAGSAFATWFSEFVKWLSKQEW